MSEDEFNKFVDDLQKEMIEEERKEYNDYIIELFHNPQNWGVMNPDNVSIIQTYEGPCGDTMQFFLKIENDIIQDISFITDGCGASVATGSQATILIKGQHIDFAENLTAEEIDNALHSLPEDHKHCAELAARTLRKAIEQYKNKII